MLIKDINELMDLRTVVVDLSSDTITSYIKHELSKFNFDDAYMNEGEINIDSCNKILFFTCKIENFIETRNIFESTYSNTDGIPLGKRNTSEYNVWDYMLKNDYSFIDHEKSLDIEDSHHAVGCTSCKQKGRIRCYKCSGNGDLKCDDCNGRGEVSCRSCNGNGETTCWSCFGKGTVKKGFGDNERTVNCSGCGGRGRNPCNSCRGGFINCSYCSGKGRKACSTCEGSREVDCGECDGYKSIDHWFVVNSKFKTNQEKLFITQPLVGFDLNIANSNNFSFEKIVFELTDISLSKKYFNDIHMHPLYDKILDYFDYKNTNQTKLVSSRLSIYQNTYVEVKFSFYQENYILYFDDTFKNSYYSTKKPSDQYELDLLNKFLTNISNNNLIIANKTVQKLSEYKYININEELLAHQINVTEAIYEANEDIKNRNYTVAERILFGIKNDKDNSDDFRKLKSKLNKIYFKNTSITALILLSFIIYKLLDKNNQFLFINAIISSIILITSYILNNLQRNIHASRFVVLVLFSFQIIFITLAEKDGLRNLSDRALNNSFSDFKKVNKVIYDGIDTIILLRKTGNYRDKNAYYLPKGSRFRSKYSTDDKFDQVALKNIPLELDDKIYSRLDGSTVIRVFRLNSEVDIDIYYSDVKKIVKENEIEVEFFKNDLEYFKLNLIEKMYISKQKWDSIQR